MSIFHRTISSHIKAEIALAYELSGNKCIVSQKQYQRKNKKDSDESTNSDTDDESIEESGKKRKKNSNKKRHRKRHKKHRESKRSRRNDSLSSSSDEDKNKMKLKKPKNKKVIADGCDDEWVELTKELREERRQAEEEQIIGPQIPDHLLPKQSAAASFDTRLKAEYGNLSNLC